MTLTDTIQFTWQSLRNNKLRTAITVAIITLGLTALLGILTAVEAMKIKLKDSFSFMGANSFSIRAKERKIQLGGTTTTMQRKEQQRQINIPPITYEEANAFKQNYNYPAVVSIANSRNQRAVSVQYEAIKTNPSINFMVGDENYLEVNGLSIQYGRNVSLQESEAGHNVCLVGTDVVKKLFKENATAVLGKMIRIDGHSFLVIGVLGKKGTGAFFSFDNVVFVTNKAAQQMYTGAANYVIGVKVKEVHQLQAAMDESESVFKAARKIAITTPANFALEKSDRLATLFISASRTITFAAIAIGLITLFGAAIGLMNIMLVAVNERTKEVGLIKAIGGTNKVIKQQFLLESIVIAIMGAFFGILLGVAIGNLVGYFLGVPFFVPWGWLGFGILLCIVTGLLAGIYPAIKAAKLQPIQALRYE